MAALDVRVGGGKSGLHGNTVPANGRRGRPQGKCHRKQTAMASAREGAGTARVKGCGKSAPRSRQREWQGKPHREQDQIGTAGRAIARACFRAAVRVGRTRRSATDVPDEWPSPLRGGTEPGLQAVWQFSFGLPQSDPAFRHERRLDWNTVLERIMNKQNRAVTKSRPWVRAASTTLGVVNHLLTP